MTDKSQEGWACFSKALDEFEGDKLIDGALHSKGDFCAIGAALHVAKVKEVEEVDLCDVPGYRRLYDIFQTVFKIDAAEVYTANDTMEGDDKERLLFMRVFAKAKADGASWETADLVASEAILQSREKK